MKKEEFLKKEGLKIRKVTSKDRVIRNYIEKDNNKVRIVKAPNGKYFNEYTSHGAGAGPFTTFKEAETMLHKHRPTAKKVTSKTIRVTKTTKTPIKKCVNTQKNTATKSIYARKSPIKRAPSPNTAAMKKTKTTKGVKALRTKKSK